MTRIINMAGDLPMNLLPLAGPQLEATKSKTVRLTGHTCSKFQRRVIMKRAETSS